MAKQKRWITVQLFESVECLHDYDKHGRWSGKRPIGPLPKTEFREFKTEAGFRQFWELQCSWLAAEVWDSYMEFGFHCLHNHRVEVKS